MAAMCNRGDALMYATEFSQAAKPWVFTVFIAENEDLDEDSGSQLVIFDLHEISMMGLW